jgi:hypothetical protein
MSLKTTSATRIYINLDIPQTHEVRTVANFVIYFRIMQKIDTKKTSLQHI